MKIELHSSQKQKDKISISSLGNSNIHDKFKPVKPKIIELKEEYNALKDDFITNMLNKPNLLQQDGVKLFSFIEKQNVLLNQINSIFKNCSYNSNKSDDNFITPNTSTNNTNNAKTNEIYNSNASLKADSKKLETEDSFVLPNKILEYKEKLDQKDSLITNLNNEIFILKEKLNNQNLIFSNKLKSEINADEERTVTFENVESDLNTNFIRNQNHNQNYLNDKLCNNNNILTKNIDFQAKDSQAVNDDYYYKNKIESNYLITNSDKNSPCENTYCKSIPNENFDRLNSKKLDYANINEVYYERNDYNSNQSSKLIDNSCNTVIRKNENRNNLSNFDKIKTFENSKHLDLLRSEKLKNLNINLLGEDYKTLNQHFISSSPIHQDWDEIHKVLNKFDNNKYLESKINPKLNKENQEHLSNTNIKSLNSPSAYVNNLNPTNFGKNPNDNKYAENSYLNSEKRILKEENSNIINSSSSKINYNNYDNKSDESNLNLYQSPEANSISNNDYYNYSLDDRKILSLEKFNNSKIEIEKLNGSLDSKVNNEFNDSNNKNPNLNIRIENMKNNTNSFNNNNLNSIPLRNYNNNNISTLKINSTKELKKYDSSKSLNSNSFRINNKQNEILIENKYISLKQIKDPSSNVNMHSNFTDNNYEVSFDNNYNNKSSISNNSFSNDNINVSVVSTEAALNNKKRKTGNLQLGYSNLKYTIDNTKIKKSQNKKVLIKTDKSINNCLSINNYDQSNSTNKNLNNSLRAVQNNTSLNSSINKNQAKSNLKNDNNDSNISALKRNAYSIASLNVPKPINNANGKNSLKLNKCSSKEKLRGINKKDSLNNVIITQINHDNNETKNSHNLKKEKPKDVNSIIDENNNNQLNMNIESETNLNNNNFNENYNIKSNNKIISNIRNDYVVPQVDANEKENNYVNNIKEKLNTNENHNNEIYIHDSEDYENDKKDLDNSNFNPTSNYRNNSNCSKSNNNNNNSLFTQMQINFLNSNFEKIREETEEYAEDHSESNNYEDDEMIIDDFKYDYETYEKNLALNSVNMKNNNYMN